MTATIPTQQPDPGRRRRVRLSTMEILGFMDTPTLAGSQIRVVSPPPRPVPVPERVDTPGDPFEDWTPSEVGSRLLTGRIRWGVILTILSLLVGAGASALWLYERPSATAAAAVSQVTASAQALLPQLHTGLDLNDELVAGADGAVVSSRLLALNGVARDLFELSASLPAGESELRAFAVDAATDALDGSRLLADASAYRTVVAPILILPDFETDSTLIELETAVEAVVAWRTDFEVVRRALPEGPFSAVGDELALISAQADVFQASYIDSLRTDDVSGAVSSVENLADRLESVDQLMVSTLTEVQMRIDERFGSAIRAIEALLS